GAGAVGAAGALTEAAVVEEEEVEAALGQPADEAGVQGQVGVVAVHVDDGALGFFSPGRHPPAVQAWSAGTGEVDVLGRLQAEARLAGVGALVGVVEPAVAADEGRGAE